MYPHRPYLVLKELCLVSGVAFSGTAAIQFWCTVIVGGYAVEDEQKKISGFCSSSDSPNPYNEGNCYIFKYMGIYYI